MDIKYFKEKSHTLKNGETIHYVELPILKKEVLKRKINRYEHTRILNSHAFSIENGLLIKCPLMEDALDVAAYANLKMYYERKDRLNLFNDDYYFSSSDHDSDSLFSDETEEPQDEFEEEMSSGIKSEIEIEKSDTKEEVENFINENSEFIRIPIIDHVEYINHCSKKNSNGFAANAMFHVPKDETFNMTPYWFGGSYPIILSYVSKDRMLWTPSLTADNFKNANRLITIVKEFRKNIDDFNDSFSNKLDEEFENKLSFELNYEIINVPQPDYSYYREIFNTILTSRGYKLSSKIDLKNVIDQLKSFRGNDFSGILDIERLIAKMITKKSKKSNIIRLEDITKVIAINPEKINIKKIKSDDGFDRLIGLENVKDQVDRLVKSIQFEKKRSANLGVNSESHLSAVFMGNPGTAKTTVARYLGKLMAEKQCLSTGIFKEVTRKDLVGQYVGWTAMKVSNLFKEVQGGVLFIDEAYSLLNESGRDLFADEAINEIIFQMENNPDTMVIFAGYPHEMEHFVTHANPGLKSRLTNIIRFNDYSSTEMIKIFYKFADDEKYEVKNAEESTNILDAFLDQMSNIKNVNLGNGRLMRKVFKRAIEFKANRNDDDMCSILPNDIRKACDDIYLSESHFENSKSISRVIGF